VYFSFFTFFSVSSHILGPTVCVSHFERFSLFLAIFQVLPSEFLIFLLCKCFFFSPYSRSYSVCVPFSTFFCFLAIIQVLHCVFLIFHIFECFLPYSRSNSVCVSFSTFLSFLAIVQVYFVYFSFSTFFNVSSHILGPTVFVSHFPRFSVFFAIFQVLPC